MKKLVFVLSLATLSVIVALIIFITKFKTTAMVPSPLFPQRGITLNGISEEDANMMVTKFMNDTTSSDPKTAIWLDKKWVDTVYTIIKSEGGDGIRIYFAKRLDNDKNTVVIVSTYNEGPDGAADSKFDHKDYYDHYSLFFGSKDADLTESWQAVPGADLFNYKFKCPGDECKIASSNSITCDNAHEAVTNFDTLGAKQPINTHSEWFCLAAIKAIKDDLTGTLKQKSNRIPADGIRIYFAKHTQKSTTTCKHRGRHALIIVTTYSFNIGGEIYHRDYFSCPSQSFFEKENLSGSDNAEQCQPNCQGATLPQ